MSLPTTPIDNPSVTGNWTNSRQGGWIDSPHACGRIPTDYNETYLCAGAPYGPYWEGPQEVLTTYAAMDVFMPCCNSSWFDHDTTAPYRGECNLIWCYTSNEQEALEWPACINQKIRAYGREKNISVLATQNDTYGHCEVIDYERLKHNAAPSLYTGLWNGLVGGLLVTAVMQIL